MAGKSRSMFRWRGKLRHTLLVFLVCLLVSALFWLLLAFNGNYSTRIQVPVQYVNIPSDSILYENLPTEIELDISGNGYQLLTYMLRPEKATLLFNGHQIGLSGKQGKGQAFFATASSLDYFNRVHLEVKAIRASPDTIFFNFFRQGYRKVPVQVQTNLEFENSFGLSGNILTEPESIHISGPADLLNSIAYVETETLRLSGIQQSQSLKLKIRKPNANLDYAPAEVRIELPVEKYTEALFDIPLHTENLLRRDSVHINPPLIKVSCSVALSKYASLRPDSFLVAVDLKTLHGKKLKVHLRKHPEFVKNIRLTPDYVDCIIRKK